MCEVLSKSAVNTIIPFETADNAGQIGPHLPRATHIAGGLG